MPSPKSRDESAYSVARAIVVTCPACSRRLRVPGKRIGTTIRCPICAADFKSASASDVPSDRVSVAAPDARPGEAASAPQMPSKASWLGETGTIDPSSAPSAPNDLPTSAVASIADALSKPKSLDTSNHWLLAVNGTQSGPYHEPDLLQMALAGLLPASAVVRRSDSADWQDLASALPALCARETTGDEPPLPSHPGTFTADDFAKAAGYATRKASRTHNSDLWKWRAWMKGLGISLRLLIVGIAMLIAGIVMSSILIYRE